MGLIVVAAMRVVDAPAERVYAFLADFQNEHPTIFPPNFSNYRVEQGGIGTGTVISYRFRAGNRQRDYRMNIEADEAAGRIVEHDQGSSLTTKWNLAPQDGGARTRVELESSWEGASGIGGFFERTFAPRVLRRMYDDELSRLARALAPAGDRTETVRSPP